MAKDGAMPESEIVEFPNTNIQFASLLDNYIKGLLGNNTVPKVPKDESLSILLGDRISFNLELKKDSFTESVIESGIKEYLSTFGITCKLVNEDQPHWNVYYLKKDEKDLGHFNTDLYPKGNTDLLLITFSKLEFN